MTTLPIPRLLAEAAGQPDNRALRDWLATVPRVVDELSERWQLRVGDPFEPGGQCAWVAPAYTRNGDGVVLKVGWLHPEATHEADGLRIWAGDGAVRVYAAQTVADTSALLLERCVPGTPLAAMAEPDQDVIVAGLLRRLWRPPPEDHPFRPLRTMCEQWSVEFEAKSPGGIDPGLARDGIALFRALPATAGQNVLLCTDLHAENVLAARREPWLVIDPKPYVGDPAYDVVQHMLNCERRLGADPTGLARRMAGLLDLDAERVRLWLFARCVQQSVEWPWLADVATRLAP